MHLHKGEKEMKMIDFLKRNIIKVLITLTISLPILINCFAKKFIVTIDDKEIWIGFFGSYFGAILGACVTMYVLFKTLKDNREIQTKSEIVEFCNKITEKNSLFAQKYEETMYIAHGYLAMHECESNVSKPEFDMYKEFLSAHHSAKALLYEIKTYFVIRRDIEAFNTYKLKKVIENANITYDVFCDFESEVAKSSNVKDINTKRVVDSVESFLSVIGDYLFELLNKNSPNGGKMKSIEDIYNCVNKKGNKEDIIKHYIDELKNEIGDNRTRLLIYKSDLEEKTDFAVPTFWISTIAAVLSIVSIIFSLTDKSEKIVFPVMGLLIVFIIINVYYIYVIRDRKKYCLMRLAIQEIERELTEINK